MMALSRYDSCEGGLALLAQGAAGARETNTQTMTLPRRPLSLVRRLATAATTAGTKPAPATSGAAAAAVLPWAEFFRLRQQRSIG